MAKVEQTRERMRPLGVLIPIALAVAIMMPRLLSAQFGFFDDPVSISTARHILSGEWSLANEGGTGRFRPLYWLYFAGLYGIAGERPFWFFLGNLLLLCAEGVLLARLVRKFAARHWGAGAAGILFLLSGPVIESTYTLSKPELLQAFFLMVWLSTASAAGERDRRSWHKVALGSLAVFLGCCTKETAMVVLPIGLLWFAVDLYGRRSGWLAADQGTAPAYGLLASPILGTLMYLALRGANEGGGILTGNYTGSFDFSPDWLIANTRIWLDLLVRDSVFVLPWLVAPALMIISGKGRQNLRLLSFFAIWCTIWLAIYLPWRFTVEYYLLPFAIGIAALAGDLLASTAAAVSQTNRTYSIVARTCLLAGGMLFLLTIPNNISNARLQLAVDSANEEMLHFVTQQLPVGSLLYINIQEPNEYVANFQTLVSEIEGRADIEVHSVSLGDLKQEQDPFFVVSPVVENQFYPSVRMGVYEHTSRAWNESLLSIIRGRETTMYQDLRRFPSSSIDAMRLFCPLVRWLPYCDVPNSPIDGRVFGYGWIVYRVSAPEG